MPIRAVIFDFGEVLVRLEDRSGQRKWEKRLGLAAGELAGIVFESEVTDRSMVGEATEADIWRHAAARLGLDDDQTTEIRLDFWSGERVDRELVAFLRSLRPRYKTAILSNAWPGSREVFARLLGPDDLVDETIISAEEGVAKPDARVYQIAVDRLGVQPLEAVFVDDMAQNVQAAREFGMRAIQFKSTRQVIAEVRKYLNGK